MPADWLNLSSMSAERFNPVSDLRRAVFQMERLFVIIKK
jgi:hypothetical protein